MSNHNQAGKAAKTGIIMLGVALAMRQVSMSMVAPFLSTYCKALSGYTPLLAGLALGIFGLTQAIFQVPYGMLSDRFGNKPIMVIGLLQTDVGLVLAYFTKNIGLLIFARALQGSGAVIGVGYSWAAGIAGEKIRTKAMGLLSACVSFGAAAAFILGPLLRQFMGVSQMFLVCALAIFVTVLYIFFFIRDTGKNIPAEAPNLSDIHAFFRNRKLVSFGLLAFLNNFMMMSVFYAVPIYLTNLLGENNLWKVFLPAIPIAFLAMRAAVMFADRGHGDFILIFAFLLSSVGILFCLDRFSLPLLVSGIILFFCGYISLASVVAAGINQESGDRRRGTVNGIFNAMQFLGNFAGPAVTGILWGISQRTALLVIFCAGVIGAGIAVWSKKAIETTRGEGSK